MSALSDGEGGGERHPRLATDLYGHAEAEQALLSAYRSGRMPHAWLIAGPPGIGKATLAYRAARFVLAHPDPQSPEVAAATTLGVDPGHPAFRRIAAQAHPDLLALFRTEGESGKLRTVIGVDQVRRTVGFFGSTAAEGGWRVCIVDTADDLNEAAFNALLKVLEEPPPRSLILLLTEAVGRLSATIRSRCRRLPLRALSDEEVAAVIRSRAGADIPAGELATAVAAGQGSPGRALALLDGGLVDLRQKIAALIAQLPRPDAAALHGVADALAGTDPETLELFVGSIQDHLRAQLHTGEGDPARLAPLAEVWEKLVEASRDVEAYNLDRKPFVFNMVARLSGIVR